MDSLTFEQLPEAVRKLYSKLEQIEQLLLSKEPEKERDELLTVQDAASFLHLSVPTIYGLISKGGLPVMKRSKRCYFSKADLITYLKEGKRKSVSEVDVLANNYLSSKRK